MLTTNRALFVKQLLLCAAVATLAVNPMTRRVLIFSFRVI
jgi:hypothetical protein